MKLSHASRIESIATKLATWVGTPTSIILHTVFFIGIFVLRFIGIAFDEIMLLLTTIVSLEAIYLSLFIQMTVNQHSASLEDVEEDIDEISENVEDISEDIDDVQEDVEFLETKFKDFNQTNHKLSKTNLSLMGQGDTSQLLNELSKNLSSLTQEMTLLRQEVKQLQSPQPKRKS